MSSKLHAKMTQAEQVKRLAELGSWRADFNALRGQVERRCARKKDRRRYHILHGAIPDRAGHLRQVHWKVRLEARMAERRAREEKRAMERTARRELRKQEIRQQASAS